MKKVSPPHRFGLVDATSRPAYGLGEGHPFADNRQEALFDLLQRHGAFTADERLDPPSATTDELALAHDRAYIDFVASLAEHSNDLSIRSRGYDYGFGNGDNPIRPNLHATAAAVVGATLGCVRAVVSGERKRAFQSTGGLHHAMPDRASGFCIYNDLVVGIRDAQRLGVERVAYIDYDVHHGDGVQHAFRDDPSVLTISFHEDPAVRWPGTGHVGEGGKGKASGSIVNLPFASGTGDASWQQVVERVLETALDRFQPQLIVTQHGCDPHYSDPLAELNLTTASFDFAARLSLDLANRHCNGAWVATGGGGYQPIRVLPRAWAMTWLRLAEREVPELVDPDWHAHWSSEAGGPLATQFIDPPYDDARAATAAVANERMLETWLQTEANRSR